MARRTFIRLQLRKSGSGHGNRAIGSNQVWCYFLVHTFKIKKVWIDFIKRFPRYSKVNLRAFGSKFWQFRFAVYTFQTKKTALDYFYPFLSFSVHNFCARTDGRTDRHFSKKFSFFFLIKNIYTCLYLSRLFFKFHPHSDQS